VSTDRYASMWERLVANTHEPENEQACWPWSAQLDRYGYPRFALRLPFKPYPVNLMAHIAAYVIAEARPETLHDFWLAYLELRCSGLELDHTCNNESCIYPDHHEPVTHQVNCQRRNMRRIGVIPS